MCGVPLEEKPRITSGELSNRFLSAGIPSSELLYAFIGLEL